MAKWQKKKIVARFQVTSLNLSKFSFILSLKGDPNTFSKQKILNFAFPEKKFFMVSLPEKFGDGRTNGHMNDN